VLRDPQDASRLTSVAFFDPLASAERLFRKVTQAAMPQGMSQRIVASGQTAILAMARRAAPGRRRRPVCSPIRNRGAHVPGRCSRVNPRGEAA
jgi:hypothetical protein